MSLESGTHIVNEEHAMSSLPSAGEPCDEELIRLARSGDENSFSALVGRYSLMIRYEVSSFNPPHGEFEDLIQEGLLGLLFAVRSFDKDKSSFRTYAAACVRNRLVSVIKRWGAAKAIPSSELVSMDDSADIADSAHDGDPVQLIVQREDDSRLNGRLQKLLSQTEYEVLMCYIQAYTYNEISKKLGISRKSVDNALQRIRRKLVSTSLLGG